MSLQCCSSSDFSGTTNSAAAEGVGALLGLAGPYSLQFLIDAVFQQDDPVLLNQITFILIGIFALQSIFHFLRGYLLAYIGERVIADLRLRLFEHLPGLRPGGWARVQCHLPWSHRVHSHTPTSGSRGSRLSPFRLHSLWGV